MGTGTGMGTCRERVMHSSGRCGWRELLALHTPPTPPLLHPREHHGEGASNFWGLAFRDTASLAVLTPELAEHPRFPRAQHGQIFRLPSSPHMPQLTKLHVTIPSQLSAFTAALPHSYKAITQGPHIPGKGNRGEC